jgi:hypothetical protein
MSKALRVRIESNGQVSGTKVFDATDDEEIGNVLAARFEYRVDHPPIIVLELLGGEILVSDAVLGMAETQLARESLRHG